MSRRHPLQILTWHVHGSYLYYLSQVPHDFYLPVKPGRPEGYGGKLPGFEWPENVHELPADDVSSRSFDCILFQSEKNYQEDQYQILSARQRSGPRIFLEHDPPRKHPTNTRHVVDDADVRIVHVTPFNELMWNSGASPTRVIDHGVLLPDQIRYSGHLDRGVAVVNGLQERGRRLGIDVFQRVQQEVPIDLVGIGSDQLGGLGEIPHDQLPELLAEYRFFFNPIRYTSLGLAVCEAMMVGVPIVGLATTEMATAVENGESGYVDTDVNKLIRRMQELIDDPAKAQHLSKGARRQAYNRFGIQRFVREWIDVFDRVVGRTTSSNHEATRVISEKKEAS